MIYLFHLIHLIRNPAKFADLLLEGVEQVVLFQEVTQVFTDVFLQHFRKNGEHRNRSIVVLVISTAVSFKNRGNFCDKSCHQ